MQHTEGHRHEKRVDSIEVGRRKDGDSIDAASRAARSNRIGIEGASKVK